MSEQIKADFARAQKFIKAEQYAQALIILKPHKDHPRIAALIADLEAKHKPASKEIIGTVLWLVLVIVVGVIAGGVGYVLGSREPAVLTTELTEYELPPSMESAFVAICTANTDLSDTDCSGAIQSSWLLYRSKTQDCYNLLVDNPALTDRQFLGCIAATDD
jgi:hypothetical protein